MKNALTEIEASEASSISSTSSDPTEPPASESTNASFQSTVLADVEIEDMHLDTENTMFRWKNDTVREVLNEASTPI